MYDLKYTFVDVFIANIIVEIVYDDEVPLILI